MGIAHKNISENTALSKINHFQLFVLLSIARISWTLRWKEHAALYCDIVYRLTFKFYKNSVKIQIPQYNICYWYSYSIVYFYGICIRGFDNCHTTLRSVKFHWVGDGDIIVDQVFTTREENLCDVGTHRVVYYGLNRRCVVSYSISNSGT